MGISPLILASSSPRRRQLLEEAGYEFTVIEPEVSENMGLCSNCGPAELVAELAQTKATDVVARVRGEARYHDHIVLACDTVAEVKGHILGKPRDEEHARQMLSLLSGCDHRVYTGTCLWPITVNEPTVVVEITRLVMDSLTEAQLDTFIESGQWEGKAGAFGYQDGLDWVHIVEGSASNVVGLPLERLKAMLESL
ncbi:MAG: Maf family protein [Pirellulales bacterium]|nr:Maf family protein [Pirellulales bacterium]